MIPPRARNVYNQPGVRFGTKMRGASWCSVQEGGITPGDHPVLRFTVTTPNIGNADLALGDPNVHVAANDGLYEFATCHNHFRHYALSHGRPGVCHNPVRPIGVRIWLRPNFGP
jgi:hypothetical protein